MEPKPSSRADAWVIGSILMIVALLVAPSVASYWWWRPLLGLAIMVFLTSCGIELSRFMRFLTRNDAVHGATYAIQGWFLPKTLKAEVAWLIPRIRSLVRKVKAAKSIGEATVLLSQPRATNLIRHTRHVETTLRNTMRYGEDARVLRDLDPIFGDDDILARQASAFEFVLPRIDPKLPATPRPLRRRPRRG